MRFVQGFIAERGIYHKQLLNSYALLLKIVKTVNKDFNVPLDNFSNLWKQSVKR